MFVGEVVLLVVGRKGEVFFSEVIVRVVLGSRYFFGVNRFGGYLRVIWFLIISYLRN